MKKSKTKSKNDWQSTPVANLIRFVSSDVLFARIRIKGKLIRRSLKTKVLSVARLRLADLEKAERQMAEHAVAYEGGKMNFADALQSTASGCRATLRSNREPRRTAKSESASS